MTKAKKSKRSTSTVQLSYQEPLTKGANPVLASFRNGLPYQMQQQSKEMRFDLFQSERKKKQKILATQTEKLSFQGANYGPNSTSNNLHNYVVGIFDKATQKVQLVDVDHLFTLQQSIKGFKPAIDENQGEEQSHFERRKALIQEFGNKKQKRATKSLEETRIQEGQVSGSQAVLQVLEKKVQDATDEKAKLTKNSANKKGRFGDSAADSAALAQTRSQLLPPYDSEATDPLKVYDPLRFLDKDHVEAIQLQSSEFLNLLSASGMGAYKESYEISGFVARALEHFSHQTISDLQNNKSYTQIGFVFYLRALMKIFRLRAPLRKSITEISEDNQIPPILVQQIVNIFYDASTAANGRTTYVQSKTLKDKHLLYILMMALVIKNCSLELDEIAADLKRTPTNLSLYCRQLGCRVEKIKKQGVLRTAKGSEPLRAVLVVPLAFPSAKKGNK